MRDLLLFLHILAASTWLGAALWVPGDVRRSLARGRAGAEGLAARTGPALWLDLGAGAVTIVTGILVLGMDGFSHPRFGIMAGLVLSVGRFLLVAFALVPAWARIRQRITAGEDPASSQPLARRMAMFGGIAHTLWALALAGMVFPY